MIRSCPPRVVAFISLASLAGVAPSMIVLASPGRARGDDAYRSPYRVEFSNPMVDLVGDLDRGDPRREAEVPFAEWYSSRTLARWNAWGPHAKGYPHPVGFRAWSTERRRERLVAVALRYVGYGYQHHHVPDWDPPAGWPWKPTCAGANGKGFDCSNFTGFALNLGFGLRINTDVARQADLTHATAPAGEPDWPIARVELPPAYEDRKAALRTGDLVFIRSRGGEISHVVIWVGPIGRAPRATPLVIDSHGDDTRDSNGETIPCGVDLRPFREDSWYNRNASHALRVFVDP